MNWVTSLFKIGGNITAGDGLIAKGMDMFDKSSLSDEEKRKLELKMYSTWVDSQKVIASQGSATAISRRVIAWAITFTNLVTFVYALILQQIGMAYEVGELMKLHSAMRLGEAFLAVIVFYFGTHVVGALRK